jgi:hypothetical protein
MTLAVLFGLVGLAWLVVMFLNRDTGRETRSSDASAGYTGWLDGPGTAGDPRQEADPDGSTSDGASDGNGGGGDWGGGDGGGGDGGGDGGGGE